MENKTIHCLLTTKLIAELLTMSRFNNCNSTVTSIKRCPILTDI